MIRSTPTTEFIAGNIIADKLLGWYDKHARQLPWRVSPAQRQRGVQPSPYHVWLSEVMLQQTQVATVGEYFLKFVRGWPTIGDLAEADEADVMSAWAGLGYYSRARNLKKCAELVCSEHGGAFPETPDALRQLPGIGEYTASAIAAIAFDFPAIVIDGNVERVAARLAGIDTPLPAAKGAIRETVGMIGPSERPGDFAQAMMDLGATICTPKRPACAFCPINADCAAFKAGNAESLPVKPPKAKKPKRTGAAYIARRHDGAIFLRRRPPAGLLGGMSEPPTTEWNARQDGRTGASAAPFDAIWRNAGTIRHAFTHFELSLEVWLAELERNEMPEATDGWWSPLARLGEEALPTVMKKAITAAIPDAFKRIDT